jgi:hypothetical protein
VRTEQAHQLTDGAVVDLGEGIVEQRQRSARPVSGSPDR